MMISRDQEEKTVIKLDSCSTKCHGENLYAALTFFRTVDVASRVCDENTSRAISIYV